MVEVADIFREFGDEYRKSRKLPLRMLKVMTAIERCRTAELGGHIDECDSCGHLKISYNSCRNRHCPKCEGLAREKWLFDRKQELLPVEYFHIVFTIPAELNPLALRNQKEIYNILFRAASKTLLELGEDPKYLGAEIGFISILHTWGQNLMDHPHLHCLVPGGGLKLESKKWVNSKKGFLIPIKVISRLFRGKFLNELKKTHNGNKLKLEGTIASLSTKKEFQKLIDNLYQKEWVVYCKPSFRNPEHILEYLGRYTHRVAIANHRILSLVDGYVTFIYKDYKDKNRKKTMKITAQEFIRRFMLHVLPEKFVKIRYYGLLSSRSKSKLKRCLTLLGPPRQESTIASQDTWEEFLLNNHSIDSLVCSKCKQGKMQRKENLQPLSNFAANLSEHFFVA